MVSVQDLDPLQLKNVLEMSEDYVYSVQQIKWGLQYAYERAQDYLSGIDVLLNQIIHEIEYFDYGQGPEQ